MPFSPLVGYNGATTERLRRMSPAPGVQPPSPGVRNLLRNLNLLLKAAQMYGMEHVQTASKLQEAWAAAPSLREA